MLIADGNSLLSGAGGTVGSYFDRVVSALRKILPVAEANYAVGGQNTPQMITDVRSQIVPLYNSAYKNCIVVIQEGTNDMHFNQASATQAFGNLAQYSRILKQAGFKTVWVAATPRNSPPTPYAAVPSTYDWKELNQLIREAIATPQGKATAGIDAFADIAAIPQIGEEGAQNNLAYYSDGTHFFSEASYQLITPVVVQAIESLF